jgi:hypothetical protein
MSEIVTLMHEIILPSGAKQGTAIAISKKGQMAGKDYCCFVANRALG